MRFYTSPYAERCQASYIPMRPIGLGNAVERFSFSSGYAIHDTRIKVFVPDGDIAKAPDLCYYTHYRVRVLFVREL